ncbi:ATP-binding protein [Rhodococcus sp. NPDC057135]|uniref:ATP-binding protein n=1 Tax=Rhodococcus sp. NPDC057135 TaxID=3346028 RepID=UPI00362EA76B
MQLDHAVEHRLSCRATRTELKKTHRYKLIIIDDVEYIPFDQDAANLFFQLIASRYEQGSVMVTSNLPFGRWREAFSDDDVVTATVIDRRVHHAEVLTPSRTPTASGRAESF